MLNKFFYGVLVVSIIFIVSCSPKQSEIVVAEFGEYQITIDEFEKAYAKNVGSFEKAQKDSIESYNKFLDLYANFKMKLRDAEVRRLPQEKAIINELAEYEKTIGSSFLLENELYEKGIRDLYEKRKDELRISHILVRRDTLSEEEANQKALAIIDRIKNGASFEDEVKENSDDQFSKEKGGDIYYITAGMIMPDFEEIAYNTPVGTVNETPLKTKYGYHIIKVTERIPRKTKIKASHILLKMIGPKSKDGKTKEEVAQDVLARIKNGEDFGKLASEFSEDPGSKTKNGELGFFSRRQMVQEFDEAAFKLKEGEVSDLVKTQFGYHIIKQTGVEAYPEYDVEKKNLRDLYEKSRKKADYEALIKKYAEELNLTMHDEVIKEVSSNLGETLISKDYYTSEFQSSFGNSVLFTIGNESFTTDSLFSFGLKDVKLVGSLLDTRKFTDLVNKLKDNKVIETKTMTLVANNERFAGLMDEYKKGILIFRLQEDEVWNKMSMDSVRIHALYDETKESYVWPDRVSYKEIFTKNDSLANVYLGMLKSDTEFDSVMVKFNEKRRKSSKVVELKTASENLVTRAAYSLKNEGEFSDVFKNGNGWSIVQLIEKKTSHIKSFEEARAEVTSAYQDIESAQLENKYVSRLHKTYEPKLFYEELENAYKN